VAKADRIIWGLSPAQLPGAQPINGFGRGRGVVGVGLNLERGTTTIAWSWYLSLRTG